MLQKKWKGLSMFAAVITVVLCLFVLPNQAEAATIASGTCGAEGDNLTWILDDAGTLTISGTGAMDQYGSYGVWVAPWYSNIAAIETVLIRGGVTIIGGCAFYGCSNLTNAIIPDSVISIGTAAFSNCSSLTDISIPNSVVSIGSSAFSNCSSLTDVSIPASVVSIGSSAFSYCSSLMGIFVDASNSAYCNDSSGVLFNKNKTVLYQAPGALCEKYTISDGVISIGDFAFSGCSSLINITIPNSVSSIGDYAFINCSGLSSITIPDSVASIGDSMFSNCSSLTSVTIPNGLTSIGYNAFFNCSSLISITIPNSVISIGSAAFRDCNSLTSVAIPDGVTSISDQMFCSCDRLTNITIPNSISSIGDYAFYNCSSLTSIIIPASVTSIDYQAFDGCNSLKHVAYGGTQEQWNEIAIGSDNSYLTRAAVRHYEVIEEPVYWTKNCVNSGLFCELCGGFITKESSESGSHSYADDNDMLCDDCGYIRTVKNFYIYQYPSKREFALFDGVLDVADGVLTVTYSDGTTGKMAMSADMVTGFNNTAPGNQTLTVTLGSKTTTYTVKIVPGDPISLTVKTLPNTLSYITGGNVNLTGLVLTADYGNNRTAELSASDVTMDAVDMTTMGAKIVTVRKGTASASFTMYVHDKNVETIDSTLYPESSHNYAANTNETKTFTWPGASSLTLTFNTSSYTESNYDFVYIYDGAGKEIAKYSGSLSGKTVAVPGDTFRIKLTSDGGVNKYGYAFSSIVAETVLHPGVEQDAVPPTCTKPGMTAGTVCEICGMTLGGEEIPTIAHEYIDGYCVSCENVTVGEVHYATVAEALKANSGYLRLNHDLTQSVIVSTSSHLDLNGHTLTGDITIADGATLYVFDSATADYTAENRGKIVGTITGDLARTMNTPKDSYGHNYKYLTLKESDGSYSFHRYYLTVKSVVLVPYMKGEDYIGTAMDYKTVFKCNDVMAQYVTAYGTKMVGDNTVYANYVANGYSLLTGADNTNEQCTWLAGTFKTTNSAEVNAANAMRKPTVSAYITLADGTEITSAGVQRSLQDMIVYANGLTELTVTEERALGKMYNLFKDVLDTWAVDISNIKRFAAELV